MARCLRFIGPRIALGQQRPAFDRNRRGASRKARAATFAVIVSSGMPPKRPAPSAPSIQQIKPLIEPLVEPVLEKLDRHEELLTELRWAQEY